MVRCTRQPTIDEVIEHCNIDYEPDMEEFIDITTAGDVTNIP